MKPKPTKTRIVECALGLFRDRGYANVTVEEICQQAGVTRSAFYYHFSERDEVLDEFMIIADTYIQDHLQSILQAGTYVEQFYKIFDIYYSSSLQYGPEVLGQILYRSITKELDLFVPRNIASWEIYLSLVRNGQRTGQIRNPSPAETLVETAVYIGEGLVAVWCGCGASFDIAEKTHQSFDSLFMVSQHT